MSPILFSFLAFPSPLDLSEAQFRESDERYLGERMIISFIHDQTSLFSFERL